MFNSAEAQNAAIRVRERWPEIYSTVWQVFKEAVVGTGTEVAFFRRLAAGLAAAFRTFASGGVSITARFEEVHQKPRVKIQSPQFECELGDLLVVVKYRLPSGAVETKSVLYQVKMCRAGSQIADIDQNQLKLLSEWPEFSFGKSPSDAAQSFQLNPREIEFGSYLIAQRAPTEDDYFFAPYPLHPPMWWAGPVYGIAPTALRVKRDGPNSIDLRKLTEPSGDVPRMVRHIAFDYGEHHSHNAEIADLVAALYRYVGWEPDPPDEFKGYYREVTEDQIGFGILELTVTTQEEPRKPEARPRKH